MKIPRIARTTVLLIVGILGIAYEAIFVHPVDSTLVVGFFAMCGLPLFLPGGTLNTPPTVPPPVVIHEIAPEVKDAA